VRGRRVSDRCDQGGRLQCHVARTEKRSRPTCRGTSATSRTSRNKESQARLVKLAPNARHISSTNNGHEIQKEQPQLVIDSIREVVEAVHDGSRQLSH